jgi:protein-L-isoaspartate(D-aspartate) O-methyltransferase
MPDGVDQLEQKRWEYARRIAALAGIDRECRIGQEITEAFETTPREAFAGPPPWTIISPEGQVHGRSGDPADLYQDVLIALSAAKGLNNGQPSLHAFCLKALALRQGQRYPSGKDHSFRRVLKMIH